MINVRKEEIVEDVGLVIVGAVLYEVVTNPNFKSNVKKFFGDVASYLGIASKGLKKNCQS